MKNLKNMQFHPLFEIDIVSFKKLFSKHGKNLFEFLNIDISFQSFFIVEQNFTDEWLNQGRDNSLDLSRDEIY